MAFEWNLQLQRYVIEDGEPEKRVGDVFTWVAAFYCEASLALSPVREKSAIPIEKNRYRVNAEVVYISEDPRYKCCVLDFGITSISELGPARGMPLPRRCREGDYVTGDVWLDSPLCTDVQPYDIRHAWRIERITAESDDPIEPDRNHTHEIPDTGSLKAASYILHCSHVAGPASVSGKPPINEESLQYLEPSAALRFRRT